MSGCYLIGEKWKRKLARNAFFQSRRDGIFNSISSSSCN